MTVVEWANALVNETFTSEQIVEAQLASEVLEAEVAVHLWEKRLKFLRGEK